MMIINRHKIVVYGNLIITSIVTMSYDHLMIVIS